jgi:hypothetical protein
VAAATFLKNFLKKQWTEEGGTMSAKERCNFRNQLVEVLLCIDGLVLKQLAEAVCPPLKHLSQELFLHTLLSGLFLCDVEACTFENPLSLPSYIVVCSCIKLQSTILQKL